MVEIKDKLIINIALCYQHLKNWKVKKIALGI